MEQKPFTKEYTDVVKDLEKVRINKEKLPVKNGKIILDKENPNDREWFEKDENYDI
ncbi:hypothetical protein [Salipaludibacillus neizhouensis]|uniref:hypothetical protein n=1 Tax=Salipaludibacillus neizhouensis TaxID=885475 RepID=UPI001603B3FE|nr:hypothetical protein [Salipaludibacillus neizhouensis]